MVTIKVVNPVVELDGDEMTRIIWQSIRDRLILPYLDLELMSFDLGIQSRDASGDQVTVEAAQAVARCGVGVKCATITPDEARVGEFGLKRMYRSPNATLRSVVGGVIFREPVLVDTVPRLVPALRLPIVVARHAVGDEDRAIGVKIPGEGTLTLTFTPKDGSEPIEREVHSVPGPGVALSLYDQDEAIRDVARASLRYGLDRRCPVYLSTGNMVLKAYDSRFKDLFQEVHDTEFQEDFVRAGLTYEHRRIDDMVAGALTSEGGYVWVCRSHDGDLVSGLVARGFGSPGLMTSVLMSPDGRMVLAQAAHGTVTRHYRRHQQGRTTSTNPIASVFAWTRALAHRGRLDGTPRVADFAETLERVCVETVEAGQMTKDLAALISKDQPWLTTEQFLDALDTNLQKATASA